MLVSTVTVLTRTWPGLHVINEDRIRCDPELGLYAVLDGECNGGLAADVALGCFRDHRDELRNTIELGTEATRAALARTVEAAAKEVFAVSAKPDSRGCGTTLTCCVILPSHLVIAHVGDSRLYRLEARGWRLLTMDHSLVWDLRRSGALVDLMEMIRDHSTVITRALGFQPDVAIDIEVLPHGGEPLLLCTDGAWRPFDPNLMGIGPTELDGEELADWIRERHEEDGERDDASVVIVGQRADMHGDPGIVGSGGTVAHRRCQRGARAGWHNIGIPAGCRRFCGVLSWPTCCLWIGAATDRGMACEEGGSDVDEKCLDPGRCRGRRVARGLRIH
ncbi:MAG: protein phosphatase 2C domain-containing protein [Polyangiaceae bacterium]|nr:protein phosphatase 2C domain-containing protein [Polyangiaceae bacterium]